MRAHNIQTRRSRHRRILVLTDPLPFDSWYAQNFGAIGWTLQDLSGDVALATNSALALGRNAINNPTFEVDNSHWTASGAATITRSVAQAHSGAASGLATIANVNEFLAPNEIPLSAGETYNISVWVFLDGGNVSIQAFSTAASMAITAVGTTVIGSWVNLTTTGVAAITGSNIPFIIRQTSGSSNFFVDDISIQQTDIADAREFPGAELLDNPNFINWTTDDPDNWSVFGESGNDPEVSEVDSGQGHGGTNISGGNANMFTTGAGLRLTQNKLTIGKRYKIGVNIDTLIAQKVTMDIDGGATKFDADQLGDNRAEAIAGGAGYNIRTVANTNVTMASATATEANPINATNNGMAVAQPGQANIPLVFSGDGGTTRLSFATIAEINSIINMRNGGFIFAAKSDTWAAGVDVLARFAVDADNEIVIFRHGTHLKIEYRETATSSIVTIPSGSPSGMFTIGMKWDVDGFGLRGLYNGAQFDTDKPIAAAIIGNLDKDETALFAADSSGTNSWAGDGAYPALQTETRPDSYYAEYHGRTGL